MQAQIDPEARSGGERGQRAALMLQAWGAFQAQSQHARTSQCGPSGPPSANAWLLNTAASTHVPSTVTTAVL